jgi:hypothetical protein
METDSQLTALQSGDNLIKRTAVIDIKINPKPFTGVNAVRSSRGVRLNRKISSESGVKAVSTRKLTDFCRFKIINAVAGDEFAYSFEKPAVIIKINLGDRRKITGDKAVAEFKKNLSYSRVCHSRVCNIEK